MDHRKTSLPGASSHPPYVSVATLQTEAAWQRLRRTGRLLARWRDIPINWRPCYAQMVVAMRESGIAAHHCPPVWGWPAAACFSPMPRDSSNAVGWMSGRELRRGARLIRLSVPRKLCLVSGFSAWIDAAGDMLGHRAGEERATHEQLFSVPSRRFAGPEQRADWDRWGRPQHQVCMPYLDILWVRGARVVRGVGVAEPDPMILAGRGWVTGLDLDWIRWRASPPPEDNDEEDDADEAADDDAARDDCSSMPRCP